MGAPTILLLVIKGISNEQDYKGISNEQDYKGYL